MLLVNRMTLSPCAVLTLVDPYAGKVTSSISQMLVISGAKHFSGPEVGVCDTITYKTDVDTALLVTTFQRDLISRWINRRISVICTAAYVTGDTMGMT